MGFQRSLKLRQVIWEITPPHLLKSHIGGRILPGLGLNLMSYLLLTETLSEKEAVQLSANLDMSLLDYCSVDNPVINSGTQHRGPLLGQVLNESTKP
jgi:hypothetical protein